MWLGITISPGLLPSPEPSTAARRERRGGWLRRPAGSQVRDWEIVESSVGALRMVEDPGVSLVFTHILRSIEVESSGQ